MKKNIFTQPSKHSFVVALVIVIVLVVVVGPANVKADSISIDGTIQVYLSGPAITYNLQGGTASALTVTETTFTISTGGSDSVTVTHSNGLSMENNSGLQPTCVGSESRTTVLPSKTVTFTPTGTLVCGVGGSGGGGGTGGTTTSTTPTTSTPTTTTPVQTFTDVSTSGPDAVSAEIKKDIEEIVQLMNQLNVYEVVEDDFYHPNFKTTRYFAMQVSLAIAGKDCGESVTFANCKNAAIEARLVDENNMPDRFITRAQFYQMLLKAAKISVVRSPSVVNRYLCNDVTEEHPLAEVVATARMKKIAAYYKGNVCNADLAFSRANAAVFAARTLDAAGR